MANSIGSAFSVRKDGLKIPSLHRLLPFNAIDLEAPKLIKCSPHLIREIPQKIASPKYYI
jgi:hypothetical protein